MGMTNLNQVNLVGENVVLHGIKTETQQLFEDNKAILTFHASKFIGKLQNGEESTVVFIGDSTTELNATTEGQPNHVGLLETWLDEQYPGLVRVVNAGISGNNIKQMWNRIFKDVLIYEPDLVVICSGLNDAGGGNQLTVEQFQENYNMIVQEILALGHRDIILRTPNPLTIGSPANDALEPYLEVTRSIARKYNIGLFDLNAQMKNDILAGNIVQADLMYDGTHPNAAGHAYIADKFKKFFIPTDFIEIPIDKYRMLSGIEIFNVYTSNASEVSDDDYMDGKYIFQNTPGRYFETDAEVGEFTLIYREHTSNGQFVVSIDGVDQPMVDTYSDVNNYRGFITYKVPFGQHKIRIKNLNSKNAASTGYILNIEGIIYKKRDFENRKCTLLKLFCTSSSIFGPANGLHPPQ